MRAFSHLKHTDSGIIPAGRYDADNTAVYTFQCHTSNTLNWDWKSLISAASQPDRNGGLKLTYERQEERCKHLRDEINCQSNLMILSSISAAWSFDLHWFGDYRSEVWWDWRGRCVCYLTSQGLIIRSSKTITVLMFWDYSFKLKMLYPRGQRIDNIYVLDSHNTVDFFQKSLFSYCMPFLYLRCMNVSIQECCKEKEGNTFFLLLFHVSPL